MKNIQLLPDTLSNPYFTRNICIGLIDGITIPLALAAGLSELVVNNPSTIAFACIAASLAGATTMGIGGYREAKKYEPSQQPLSSSLTIGISYLAGGCIVCVPFLLFHNSIHALQWSAAISLLVLFIAGYRETSINGGKPWPGALRVLATGIVTAAAAFLVAKLFA